MSKKTITISITILTVIGICTLLVGCGGSWLSKEYENKLETYEAENLEVTVPDDFEKYDEECSDTVLSLDHQAGDGKEPYVFLTVEYMGMITSDKDADSYMKNDEDYSENMETAVEVSGEGYQGTEITSQMNGSQLSTTSNIDYLLVDKSVFKITLSTETSYYTADDIQILRDHINWQEYESNIVVDIDATYEGNTYDKNTFDETMLNVKAVLKDGSDRFIDPDEVTLNFPNGRVFKEGKTLVVDISYEEDGRKFTTTWEGTGVIQKKPSNSSGSSSSTHDGSYQNGDEVAEEMDTNNDGNVSGNEFQDAVNNYMDQNGY